ncbi:MAG: hypothetical protein J6Y55_09030, partial [Bacteroidales bacterium]|nr:hypothetical protein [Bacteroidales bacterium]
MKKFLTLFVFGVLTSFVANAQYTETKDITPLGFSGNFKFLQFSQTRGLLAISDKNVLYISTDTAKTWKTEKLPTDTVNQFIMYKDGLTGFITNSKGAYRTLNGGITWEKLPLTGIPSKIDGYEVNLVNLYFKTKDVVFYILTNKVNGKRIYKSSDCGNTWKEVAKDIYPNYGLPVGILVFNMHWNGETGYLYGNAFYAKTEDGGETWKKYCYDESLYEVEQEVIWSYDNGAAIISEDQHTTNRVFFSKDGNPTEKYNVQLTGDYYLTMAQDINGHLYALNDHGDFWHSTDSAKTWTTQSIGEENDYLGISGMHFFNEKVGVVVGYNLTSYVTTDGGKTWTKYVHGGGEGFNDIYVKNDKECFITGETGRMFYTSDGGKTWTWQDLYAMGLKSITFPTQDTGYVVSKNMLLMTIDGGKTWIQKPNEENYNLIDFVTSKVGFGYDMYSPVNIAKTMDYGDTWTTNFNKTFWENVKYRSLDFRNENEGLVTGKGNLLLHTTDGGQTWEIKETVPNNYYVWSVQNVADKGWLVSVGDEDFYGIFFCDNDFNCQLVFEGDGSDNSARYIICVNDSVYYQPINNTHYISRDYGLTWEDADFDITGQRSFANEHLAYSFDFDYNIHKTYINVRNMGITITQVQNRQLEIATDIVENISANVYLKDANGNSYSLFSSYEIKKDVPFTINIPHNIPQGTYRLFIESLNSAYKDTESEPFEVSDETAVLDISKNQTYRVQGKTLYIYDS